MTTPPAVQQYDALWNGNAHRNFCVAIRNGKKTIKVDGMPDYQLYFVRSSTKPNDAKAIFAEGLETPGKIDVDTPDDPHTNGDICLGVAFSGYRSSLSPNRCRQPLQAKPNGRPVLNLRNRRHQLRSYRLG